MEQSINIFLRDRAIAEFGTQNGTRHGGIRVGITTTIDHGQKPILKG